MRSRLTLSALLIGLTVGRAPAQQPQPAPQPGQPLQPVMPPVQLQPVESTAPKPPAVSPKSAPVAAAPEFDFGFLDGSNVKVVVLEPSVTVTTKYGKLTVPLGELKRVELGFRYPEGVEARLESAVERLAAPVYAEREEAARQLVELKEYAGPILKRSVTDVNAERRQRATAVLETVRRSVPAERVDAKDVDSIETAEFKIRGRIDSATLKIRTRQFGEAVVKVAEMKQFSAVVAAAIPDELTLDAATYSKMNWQAWLDTKVDVAAGADLEIACTGTIDQWPQEAGRYTSGPAGNGNSAPNQQGNVRVLGPNGMNPNRVRQGVVMAGAVVGKIGQGGQPFSVGAGLKLEKSPEAGRLYLQIAPSNFGNENATGEFKVKVKVGN